MAEERLALTERGDVRAQLKTGYRDGATHVLVEPLDFLARLAVLVPPPRVHVTRYHGVFAPHHALRAAITPAGRGRGARHTDAAERPVPKHVAMTWMQLLKRVFAIEIRDLPALRREAEGDREHRGPRAHRAHPRASQATVRD